MKAIRYLFILLLCFSTISCSGNRPENTYETPNLASSQLAILTTTLDDVTFISVDGKSTNGKSLLLLPGHHQITLYLGKSTTTIDENRVVVLNANFKAGMTYFIKTNDESAWIIDVQGNSVSPVATTMKGFRKSD